MLLLMLMLAPVNMLNDRRKLFDNLMKIWNNLPKIIRFRRNEKHHKAQCDDNYCNGDGDHVGDDVVASVDHSSDEVDHANDDDDNLR